MTPEGVGELYKTERSGLTRSVARIAGDDAEDLVHDAFVAFLVAGREAERPGAWVQRVARNRALNHIRRLRAVPLDESTASDGEEPDADAIRDATRAVVAEALASLPPRAREALRLRYYEGRTYEDIAERLGVRIGQAHVVVHRSIRRLGREVVGVLAAAHGADSCAPALLRLSGLGEGGEAGHEDGPCIRCESTWEELVALRALPGLAFVPVARFGDIRRSIERIWTKAMSLAEPATAIAPALLAAGVTLAALVPPAAPQVSRAPAKQAPAVNVSFERPGKAPAAATTADAGSSLSVGATADSPSAAIPKRADSVTAGPATIRQADDHTQTEVNRGGSGSAGVVVCKPLEPCPPPPSPSPSPAP